MLRLRDFMITEVATEGAEWVRTVLRDDSDGGTRHVLHAALCPVLVVLEPEKVRGEQAPAA